VRLLGRVCVEWWGAPGRLPGLHDGLRGRTRVARAGEAGQAGQVQLGHAGMGKGGGEKEWLVRPGSASSCVLAHRQVGIRNPFSFSKSFYNLQTNLNSIQI
jgi:hypothetical protein